VQGIRLPPFIENTLQEEGGREAGREGGRVEARRRGRSSRKREGRDEGAVGCEEGRMGRDWRKRRSDGSSSRSATSSSGSSSSGSSSSIRRMRSNGQRCPITRNDLSLNKLHNRQDEGCSHFPLSLHPSLPPSFNTMPCRCRSQVRRREERRVAARRERREKERRSPRGRKVAISN